MERVVKWVQLPDGFLDRNLGAQLAMVAACNFMWGIAVAMNDILIAQFREIFELSNFASAFVSSVYWGAYFVVALPISSVIKKTSYKTALILGMAFFGGGALLFMPASIAVSYLPFLVAIFVMAIGAGMLEMSCGTYAIMMGPEKDSSFRISLCQAINPIGNVAGILLGKFVVFQEGVRISQEMAGLGEEDLHAFQVESLQMTLKPYMLVAGIFIVMIIITAILKFPSCKAQLNEGEAKPPGIFTTLKVVLSNKIFVQGWFAQFCGVGAQLCLYSFTMRLVLEMDPNMPENVASNFLILGYSLLVIGRFFSTWILKKGVGEFKMLTWYMSLTVIFMLYVLLVNNISVAYVIILTFALFAPIFPVLYSTNVQHVERKYTENAGALATMTLVGGAVFPAIQGAVADAIGMHYSFIVPTLGFCYALWFVWKEMRRKKREIESKNLTA